LAQRLRPKANMTDWLLRARKTYRLY